MSGHQNWYLISGESRSHIPGTGYTHAVSGLTPPENKLHGPALAVEKLMKQKVITLISGGSPSCDQHYLHSLKNAIAMK